MPKSELAMALDAFQKSLRPLFAERGFRPRARTFHRSTEDGLVQLVSFQMGTSQPPGALELPGLRENLHGRFTMAANVWIREAAAHGCGWGDGKRLGEMDCAIRMRLGGLSGDRRDLWWRVPTDEATRAAVLDDVSQRLVRDAFPFLDALATRESITARWPRFAVELDTSMGSAWEAVCAILHAARGEKQRAAELLRALGGDGRRSESILSLASDLDVPLD